MRQTKILTVVLMFLLILVHSDVQAMWINKRCEFIKEAVIVDKKIKEDYKYLMIDVEIPQITGLIDEKSEKVINNKITDYTSVWINEVKDIAKEYFGETLNEMPTFPYQLLARYCVKRNSDILSMYIDYYQYTGGAHGATNRVIYNIDNNTGKELLLKDLFKPKYDFIAVINREINKKIAKSPENYFQGSDGFKGIKEIQQYFLEGSDLVIQFQQYEIAPYVAGMPEFRIPLDIFKDNFIYEKI